VRSEYQIQVLYKVFIIINIGTIIIGNTNHQEKYFSKEIIAGKIYLGGKIFYSWKNKSMAEKLNRKVERNYLDPNLQGVISSILYLNLIETSNREQSCL